MKKNFTNPKINIDKFDLKDNVVMLSALTSAEQTVATSLGAGSIVSENGYGYVYSIKKSQVQTLD